jgi:hypothetical protein
MKAISKLHPDLLQILTEFSDWFFARDNSHLEGYIGANPDMKKISIKEKGDEATSIPYLQEALKIPERYGFPAHSWGLELAHDTAWYDDKEIKEKARITNDKLMDFFGARNNALQMYYPSGGYIGWHNNGNARGYNIVLSCNPGGDGEFEHWDHINDTLEVFKDEPGWNCKVGYFGPFNEPDKVYWHCARTRTPRLTFSYVIFDKNLWEDMCEDINYERH